MADCPFRALDPGQVKLENELCVLVASADPVRPGSGLIIPRWAP